MTKRPRYPKFRRGPDGKPVCRGCGGAIGKGRRTWCSDKCYSERCPEIVNGVVEKRAGGKCEFCGYDFAAALNEYRRAWREDGYSRERPHPHKKNFDHILPHSEGGEHILENIRLLCEPCHKERTARWLADKAAERRNGSNEKLTDSRP